MGGETTCQPDGERLIRAQVKGTELVEAVELVRNGEVIYRKTPGSDSENLEYRVRDRVEGNAYYYLRVLQADGHQAWSSPVWVDMKEKSN